MKVRRATFKAREAIINSGEFKTLKELVQRVESLYDGKVGFKEIVSGNVVEYTYTQLTQDIKALGTALMSRGYEDAHIAIIGENSYGWLVSFLAISGLGVAVPLDKELPWQTLKTLMEKGDVTAAFSSEKYSKAMENVSSEMPSLGLRVVWNPKKDCDCSLAELIAEGNELLENGYTGYIDKQISPDDNASIQFTSGTTGANKGVLLTHRNICSNIWSILQSVPAEPVTISLLPLNHTLELNCHVLSAMSAGMEICFNASLKRMMKNIKEFKPGMTVVVPLFLEEIYSNILMRTKKEGKERSLKAAILLSRHLRAVGIDLRRVIFKDIHEKFGGNLQILICGGAALNKNTARFLTDIGFDIVNGYGITECSPLVTVNLTKFKKIESVGQTIPGVAVRIDEADEDGIGEIFVSGENVTKGYYQDEASNAVSFDGEWFKTGDYGYLDKKGLLWISGRKKNLIILDNGKNIFPEEIENEIMTELPYIKEIVVHDPEISHSGQTRQYIAANIYLDPESPISFLDEEERNAAVLSDFERVNDLLVQYKRVSFVRISDTEFEKTSTRKIIRNKISAHSDSKDYLPV